MSAFGSKADIAAKLLTGDEARRDRYEDLVIHCPRRALSHQHAGGHEQRLQEQPTRVVRSNVHSAAPHKNRARLRFGN